MIPVTPPKEMLLNEVQKLLKNAVITDEEKEIINLKLKKVYENNYDKFICDVFMGCVWTGTKNTKV